MKNINFTNCFEKICSYGGSEKKKKIVYNNEEYLLKFPDPVREKNIKISYVNNVYSEYIGCKVFESVGISVQQVLLGTYEEVSDGTFVKKVVVACKDFANDNNNLVEFSAFANSITSISKKFTTTVEDVYKVIDNIKYKCDKDVLKEKFWELFIIDTLIGNTDRHLSNFGFFEKDNEIEFAPVYGCGSCLSPLLSDEEMKNYLNDTSEFKNIVYNIYPVYSYENKKLTYSEFYNKNIEDLRKAFFKVYPNINIDKINEIIEEIPYISDVRKEFYKKSILFRKEHILDVFYRKYR